ncbi:MAG: alpha/beta hydrolase [Microbacteriaceae bacterium]
MRRVWPLRIITAVICAALAIGAVVTAPEPGDQIANTELVKLLSMSAQEAKAYVKANPSLEMDLENIDPDATAKWWKGQTGKERHDLIDEWPDYVGNLEGIDYGTRDRANRAHLPTAIAGAENAIKRNPSNQTAMQTLKSLTAISATINGKRSPRRYLISLTDDQQPLAAIAIGNLDTARQVTFNVPGMGTYTTDMQLWTQTAVNVYLTQGEVGAPAKRSVVAWIGYQTPPPGVDATMGAYAARGALKLITTIQGLQAIRKDVSKPSISVIAHSYGTTTAADALAAVNLRIYAIVMLGSAGIELRIRNAAALHSQFVYAGEAKHDTEARLGRASRTDPRSPSFGAIVFDVSGDSGTELLPVTGHAPALHSPWNDNPLSSAWSSITNPKAFEKAYAAHFTAYGYLDAGTQSLMNAAIASTATANQSLIRSR